MKQCRTTDDGVHYYLVPADAPKPQPKPKPEPRPQPRPKRERIQAFFHTLKREVESDRDLSRVWIEPEDLM